MGQGKSKSTELRTIKTVQHSKELKKTKFHVAREEKVVESNGHAKRLGWVVKNQAMFQLYIWKGANVISSEDDAREKWHNINEGTEEEEYGVKDSNICRDI